MLPAGFALLSRQWESSEWKLPISSAMATACTTLVILWLLWRIAKFTLIPALRQDEPKEYPYMIPVIGHLRAFAMNSQELLTRARLYFGDTRDPFAIMMGNQRFYIVTKPEDVNVVYRNSSTLTFEIFAQEVLNDFGCSASAIKAMYGITDGNRKVFRSSDTKPPARMARDFHIHQLFPGNLLNDIGLEFITYYERTLNIEHLASRTKYATQTGPGSISVSMFALMSDIFTNAAQEAYFGSWLRMLEPRMADLLLEFDELGWQLLFRYPNLLTSKMRSAKDQVVDALEIYFETPQDMRTDTVWFTKALEAEMRRVGINNRDIAMMVMTIYWGFATNTRKAGFWLAAYILYNPELKAALVNETAPAFEDNRVNQDYIFNHCPRLRGVWDETLRMTAFSSSVRFITNDTVVGGKVLRAGHRIMMPYRQMHMNGSVFGDDAGKFVAERFIKNPGLRKFNMAFGGGATMCPGRHLATQTVLVFVAMLLHKFDVELENPRQQFPVAEEAVPVLGIIGVKSAHDIRVNLKVKKISAH